MANLKVSIIERLKLDGKWVTKSVPAPKSRPGAKGLYMKDDRESIFMIIWREGSAKKYSPYITTLREALRQKSQKEAYLASVAQGLHVEDPTSGKVRLTISAAIDGFLADLTGHGNTVQQYTRNLRQFEKWNHETAKSRKTYVDQIDRAHIFAFKRYLESEIGNEDYTACWKCVHVNKLVKVTLGLAAGKGPVTKGDFSEVLNRPPVVTVYTAEERDKFIAACVGVEKVIWTLALKCGLRSGEIAHLEWMDIDFTRHVIFIRKKMMPNGKQTIEFRPKKGSVGDVPIPSDVLAMLEELQKTARSNVCFPTPSGRVEQNLWLHCKQIAARAGLDVAKFKPKNFRSSFATQLCKNRNFSMPEIRNLLRHRDLGSIKHYLDAATAEELAASGRMDAVWD
jgi:integrase